MRSTLILALAAAVALVPARPVFASRGPVTRLKLASPVEFVPSSDTLIVQTTLTMAASQSRHLGGRLEATSIRPADTCRSWLISCSSRRRRGPTGAGCAARRRPAPPLVSPDRGGRRPHLAGGEPGESSRCALVAEPSVRRDRIIVNLQLHRSGTARFGLRVRRDRRTARPMDGRQADDQRRGARQRDYDHLLRADQLVRPSSHSRPAATKSGYSLRRRRAAAGLTDGRRRIIHQQYDLHGDVVAYDPGRRPPLHGEPVVAVGAGQDRVRPPIHAPRVR
jgi:hypothetical protein